MASERAMSDMRSRHKSATKPKGQGKWDVDLRALEQYLLQMDTESQDFKLLMKLYMSAHCISALNIRMVDDNSDDHLEEDEWVEFWTAMGPEDNSSQFHTHRKFMMSEEMAHMSFNFLFKTANGLWAQKVLANKRGKVRLADAEKVAKKLQADWRKLAGNLSRYKSKAWFQDLVKRESEIEYEDVDDGKDNGEEESPVDDRDSGEDISARIRAEMQEEYDSRLEQEKNELAGEFESKLEESERERESAIEDLQAKMTQQEEEIETERRKSVDFGMKNKELINELAGEQSRVEAIQKELDDARQMQAEIEHEKHQARLDLEEEYEAKMVALRSQIDTLEGDQSNSNETVAALAECEKCRGELTAKIEAVELSLSDKNDELDATRNELETAQDENRAGKKELEEALSRATELESEKNVLEEELANLKDQQSEAGDLMGEIAQLKQEVEESQSAVKTRDDELDELRTKVEESQTKLQENALEIEAQQEELQQAQADVKRLSSEMEDVSQIRDEYKETIDRLEEELAEKSSWRDAHEEELLRLREEVAAAAVSHMGNQEKDEELARLRHIIQENESTLEELNDQAATSKLRLEEQDSLIASQNEELDELRQQLKLATDGSNESVVQLQLSLQQLKFMILGNETTNADDPATDDDLQALAQQLEDARQQIRNLFQLVATILGDFAPTDRPSLASSPAQKQSDNSETDADCAEEYLELTASVVKNRFPDVDSVSENDLVNAARGMPLFEYHDAMVAILLAEQRKTALSESNLEPSQNEFQEGSLMLEISQTVEIIQMLTNVFFDARVREMVFHFRGRPAEEQDDMNGEIRELITAMQRVQAELCNLNDHSIDESQGIDHEVSLIMQSFAEQRDEISQAMGQLASANNRSPEEQSSISEEITLLIEQLNRANQQIQYLEIAKLEQMKSSREVQEEQPAKSGQDKDNLEDLQNQIAQLTQQRDEVCATLESLQQEQEASRQKTIQLESTTKDLHVQVEQLGRENDRLSSEEQRLKQQIAHLQERMEALLLEQGNANESRDLEERTATMEMEIAQLREEKDKRDQDLQRSLETARKDTERIRYLENQMRQSEAGQRDTYKSAPFDDTDKTDTFESPGTELAVLSPPRKQTEQRRESLSSSSSSIEPESNIFLTVVGIMSSLLWVMWFCLYLSFINTGDEKIEIAWYGTGLFALLCTLGSLFYSCCRFERDVVNDRHKTLSQNFTEHGVLMVIFLLSHIYFWFLTIGYFNHGSRIDLVKSAGWFCAIFATFAIVIHFLWDVYPLMRKYGTGSGPNFSYQDQSKWNAVSPVFVGLATALGCHGLYFALDPVVRPAVFFGDIKNVVVFDPNSSSPNILSVFLLLFVARPFVSQLYLRLIQYISKAFCQNACAECCMNCEMCGDCCEQRSHERLLEHEEDEVILADNPNYGLFGLLGIFSLLGGVFVFEVMSHPRSSVSPLVDISDWVWVTLFGASLLLVILPECASGFSMGDLCCGTRFDMCNVHHRDFIPQIFVGVACWGSVLLILVQVLGTAHLATATIVRLAMNCVFNVTQWYLLYFVVGGALAAHSNQFVLISSLGMHLCLILSNFVYQFERVWHSVSVHTPASTGAWNVGAIKPSEAFVFGFFFISLEYHSQMIAKIYSHISQL